MRVIAGPEKKTRVMSEKERRITAYHEMGHAIVGNYLEHSDPVHKISVIGRGQALGYTISMPTEDRFLTTRAELTDSMAMTLGGRAAEEIVFGEITTGASNDIEKVTATAKAMVMRYGMSERLGPRVFGHDHSQPFLGREFGSEPDYSDEIAHEIDDEIRRIVESAHQRAKDILTEHRETLNTVSEILVRRETIEKAEFEALSRASPRTRSSRRRSRRRSRRPRRRRQARPRRTPHAPAPGLAGGSSARRRAAQARAVTPGRALGVRCVMAPTSPSRSSWASSTSRPTRSPTAASGSTRRRRSRTGSRSSPGRGDPRHRRRVDAARRRAGQRGRGAAPRAAGARGARRRGRAAVDRHSKAAVAAAALDAGATIVNDVTALRGDAADGGARRASAAATSASCTCSASRARCSATRATATSSTTSRAFLAARLRARRRPAASTRQRVWLDPGIGFGRAIDHNLTLLARLDEIVALGRPVVVGTSRKSFLGTITGRDTGDRVAGTIATNVLALARGAGVFRVHDVAGGGHDALAVAAASRLRGQWGTQGRRRHRRVARRRRVRRRRGSASGPV